MKNGGPQRPPFLILHENLHHLLVVDEVVVLSVPGTAAVAGVCAAFSEACIASVLNSGAAFSEIGRFGRRQLDGAVLGVLRCGDLVEGNGDILLADAKETADADDCSDNTALLLQDRGR